MADTSSTPASRGLPRLAAHLSGPAPCNFPETQERLIGREDELASILQLLERRETRLLTLTGPGGSGKTRFAIEVASRFRSHTADGVAFVDLTALSEPAHVVPAIAHNLGLHETTAAPVLDQLIDLLRDREILLVLDNFEHLLDAVSAVTAIITACPRIIVLVTSRAALRITAEHQVHLPPLDLPTEGIPTRDIAHAASVQLYVEIAKSMVPGFNLTAHNADAVAEICRRLDGLPLAIKLAASRSRVLDPTSLLTRLEPRLPLLSDARRDAPTRQRTMYDTIAWSYSLLREHEQILFRRLACFAGGFTLELAELMSRELVSLHPGRDAHPGPPGEIPVLLLDALEILIDHHLVEREDRNGDIRFRMLETIHEFGLDRLEASEEAEAVRTAHAAAITAWAETTKPLMFEARQNYWLDRGAAEQPNVRAALEWALAHSSVATAHRLAAANGPVWLKRSMLHEARAWLNRILPQPGPVPPEAVTVCRFIASTVAYSLGETDAAISHASIGLRLARETGDKFGEGLALMMQSGMLITHDLTAAERTNEAAIACMQDLPGQPRMASLLGIRAEIAARRGDPVAYARLAREAYEYAVAVEDSFSISGALLVRAEAAIENKEWTEALTYLRDSMDHARHIDSLENILNAVVIATYIASACGHHRLAVRWITLARAEMATFGLTSQRGCVAREQTLLTSARRTIGAKAIAAEQAAVLNHSLLTIENEVRTYRPGNGASGAGSASGSARLTSREEEVLCLITQGFTDLQIAEKLFISRPTASRHVSNILSKLDVNSRTAAVDAAHRLGLIDTHRA